MNPSNPPVLGAQPDPAAQTRAPTPGRKPLLPLDDALAQLHATVQPLTEVQTLATQDADGRVLAHDVVSALQVPAFDNSAMDGYAVRAEDLLGGLDTLHVTQRIAAGAVGTALEPGCAARIFTGAPIPPGADAVLMQEDCVLLPESDGPPSATSQHPRIRIDGIPLPGQHIRHAGEDVRLGDTVLHAGLRLNPAALGLAASIGVAQLRVVRKPRVALFSTGDELIMPGTVLPEAMPPGAIYNSNRFFLINLLRRLGCEVTDLGIVPDQRAATIAALQAAAQGNDLILTSGGVSVGEEDHIKPAVQALGTLDLWQLAIKPGKPFAHGRIGAAHFVGLPGNPVSSLVTFLLLVRPVVLWLQGVPDVAIKSIAARADFDWPRADKRREFLRVRRNTDGGLALFDNQSSGVLTSAVWGDGLVDVQPGAPIVYGQTVRYIPFSELL